MSLQKTSQLSNLSVMDTETDQGTRTSQAMMLAVYGGSPTAESSKSSQALALGVYNAETDQGTRMSQAAVLAVYGENVREQLNQRAWGFQLDGHAFYVLHLGQQGTWVYDGATQQWSQWYTQGYPTWNMESGYTWFGRRIIAGGSDGPSVWEIDPNAELDEGFRTIKRAVTGIVAVRGREKSLDVGALRLTASVGSPSSLTPSLDLRWSDDGGNTWSDTVSLELSVGDFDQSLDFRSLGTVFAPGRVFEITDEGGLVRIDDATLDVGDE